MNILINASNLSAMGGAAQVADSICRKLYRFQSHHFIVVLPPSFEPTANVIRNYANVTVFEYAYPRKDWKSLVTKRNKFLDSLILTEHVDRVLTIFGPSKWVPRCKHLCGFAYPHIPLADTAYFKSMSWKKFLKAKLEILYMTILFNRCSKVFFTENPLITELVRKKLCRKRVYTVTNNYNQLFDQHDTWKKYPLPSFDGIRIFAPSSLMPHKNLGITIDVARILKEKYPSLKFQFVLPVKKELFLPVPEELKAHFYFTGKQHISIIPTLYAQCDVVFQPSLLECFSASYPEAMKMQKPLVVPDLPFTRGLCENAAFYYSPLSAEEAANRLYESATDENIRNKIIAAGRKQLAKYDTSEQRAEKLIKICESL